MRLEYGRELLGALAPSRLPRLATASKQAAEEKVLPHLRGVYGELTYLIGSAEKTLQEFQESGGTILREEDRVTYRIEDAYLTKILNQHGKAERYVYCLSRASVKGRLLQKALIAEHELTAYQYFRTQLYQLLSAIEYYDPELGGQP